MNRSPNNDPPPGAEEGQDEDAWRVIDEIHARNLDKTAEEVELDVAEALRAVRAQERRKANRRANPTRTKAHHEAFLSAAGSWKDFDAETFIADTYQSRGSSRPPVDLDKPDDETRS